MEVVASDKLRLSSLTRVDLHHYFRCDSIMSGTNHESSHSVIPLRR